jgi:DEAD/DEAH box helicase domain-containing protein
VRNPDWLLEGAVEAAAIDPQNPYILANHLGCAAYELPLKSEEHLGSTSLSRELTGIMEQEVLLKQIDGRWYWSSPEYPAGRTNLRTMSGRSFSITLSGGEPQVIGTLDEASVQLLAHPGAIYLHEGDTFRVRNLDFEMAIASVERVDVDYYTRPLVQSQLRVTRVRESKALTNGQVYLGEVESSWSVIAFRKIKFYTQDNLGVEALSLPTQHMQTIGLWITFNGNGSGDPTGQAGSMIRGLQALQSVFSSALPMLAMCDRTDVGSLIQMDSERGCPALYMFDRYPGGMGFAERGFEDIRELFELAYKIVAGCGCDHGCPSCVGVAEPAFAGAGGLVQFLPDKAEALRLLQGALQPG